MFNSRIKTGMTWRERKIKAIKTSIKFRLLKFYLKSHAFLGIIIKLKCGPQTFTSLTDRALLSKYSKLPWFQSNSDVIKCPLEAVEGFPMNIEKFISSIQKPSESNLSVWNKSFFLSNSLELVSGHELVSKLEYQDSIEKCYPLFLRSNAYLSAEYLFEEFQIRT